MSISTPLTMGSIQARAISHHLPMALEVLPPGPTWQSASALSQWMEPPVDYPLLALHKYLDSHRAQQSAKARCSQLSQILWRPAILWLKNASAIPNPTTRLRVSSRPTHSLSVEESTLWNMRTNQKAVLNHGIVLEKLEVRKQKYLTTMATAQLAPLTATAQSSALERTVPLTTQASEIASEQFLTHILLQ
jgi:hypothetical protein